MIKLLKKRLLALAITVFPLSGLANDGTIHFRGFILYSACSIDSTTSQSVSLGKVSKSSFGQVGSTSGGATFKIVLSNCPVYESEEHNVNVTVIFDGKSTDGKVLQLANTQSSESAQGVGIALYEQDGTTAIPLSTSSASIPLSSKANQLNTLSFVAKYIATANNVVGGQANGSVDFTVTYQ